jgi:4-hydroxybutyrate CoA-transferase
MKMEWAKEAVPASVALRLIQSGMKVFVHGACATPTPLLEALCAQSWLESAAKR